MGSSYYDFNSRSTRATTDGYYTKSASDTFTQTKEGKAHESMCSQGVTIREARDSDVHPNTLPIICTLDLTGSMGDIPAELVKDGLPTLMSNIIQRGIESPALLFLGVGDHETDRFPLQVGQFESGDAELDMWLTRTYLEKGGGGNKGESYMLAWYFAAFHTVTDAWEKRKEKGFLFTIGDEPCLPNLPASAIKEIMGNNPQTGYSTKELLEAAKERWNLYHLVVMHSEQAKNSVEGWKELLGQNCLPVASYREVANTISKVVIDNYSPNKATSTPAPKTDTPSDSGFEFIKM